MEAEVRAWCPQVIALWKRLERTTRPCLRKRRLNHIGCFGADVLFFQFSREYFRGGGEL